MLFNSYAFVFLYLPLVFAGFFALGRRSHRLAALWLGIASLVFYSVWDSRFLLLLLASIAFNYGAGYWLGQLRAPRGAGGATRGGIRAPVVLAAAIAIDLGLLGYYKYANFFREAINQASGGQLPALDIVLPLGISFFTFTQIAFLVDVYRGIAREYNFLHYLLFVTYFPHLIAGPVLHHKQMMPQFAHAATYRIDAGNVAVGLTIFVLGLAKKMLLADPLAEYATPVFAAAQAGAAPIFVEAWVGALAYTLQLYFDFSGYSDMAVGLSLLFNVRLPMNFNSPYRATSIIEFWRRWHMTLSAFLRDYLYIPLGGNRLGRWRRHGNLFLTMLLGGLWHGAAWTFVVWGGLHGVYLILNHAWRAFKTRLGWGDGGPVGRLAAGALTFLAVVVAWVFFRAESFAAAQAMLAAMAGAQGLPGHGPALLPVSAIDLEKARDLLLVGLLVVFACPNALQLFAAHRPTTDPWPAPETAPQARRLQWRPTPAWAWTTALLLVLGVFGFTKASEFLYFQF